MPPLSTIMARVKSWESATPEEKARYLPKPPAPVAPPMRAMQPPQDDYATQLHRSVSAGLRDAGFDPSILGDEPAPVMRTPAAAPRDPMGGFRFRGGNAAPQDDGGGGFLAGLTDKAGTIADHVRNAATTPLWDEDKSDTNIGLPWDQHADPTAGLGFGQSLVAHAAPAMSGEQFLKGYGVDSSGLPDKPYLPIRQAVDVGAAPLTWGTLGLGGSGGVGAALAKNTAIGTAGLVAQQQTEEHLPSWVPEPVSQGISVAAGLGAGLVAHNPSAFLKAGEATGVRGLPLKAFTALTKGGGGGSVIHDAGEGATSAERAGLIDALRSAGVTDEQLIKEGLIEKPGAGGRTSPPPAPAMSAKPAYEPKPFDIPGQPAGATPALTDPAANRAALDFAQGEHSLRLGENVAGAEIGQGRAKQVADYRQSFQEALLRGATPQEAADEALGAARGGMRQTFADAIPAEHFPALEAHAASEYAAGTISDYEHMQIAQDLRDLQVGKKWGLQPAEFRLWQKVFGDEVAGQMAAQANGGKAPVWAAANPATTMPMDLGAETVPVQKPGLLPSETGDLAPVLPEPGVAQSPAGSSLLRGDEPIPVGSTPEMQALAASRGTAGDPLNLQPQPTTPNLGAPEALSAEQLAARDATIAAQHADPAWQAEQLANTESAIHDRLRSEAGLAPVIQQGTGALATEAELRAAQAGATPSAVNGLKAKVVPPRTATQRVWTHIADILNLPMGATTLLDLSAELRQGLAIGSGNIKQIPKAFRAQIMALRSVEGAAAAREAITSHPYYGLLRKSGTFLATEADDAMRGEEVLASHWLNRIPFLRGTARAYVAYLDTLRAGVFYKELENMIRTEAKGGPKVTLEGPGGLAQLGDVINHGSGRGTGAELDRIGGLQVHPFFSARNFASRPQLLVDMFTKSGVARKQAIQQVAGLGGTIILFDGLVKATGLGSVGVNPLGGDFGKATIGPHSVDLSGGLASTVRFGAQFASGKYMSGPNVKDANRLETLGRFTRGKLSPTASFITDLLLKKDYQGQPVDWGKLTGDGSIGAELSHLGVPLVYGDILNAGKAELGDGVTPQGILTAAAVGTLAFFGASTQSGLSPSEQLGAKGMTEFGKDYYSLEPSQQKVIQEKYPSVYAAAQSAESRQATEQKVKLFAQQQASDKLLMSGQITPFAYQQQAHDRKALLRGAEGIIYADKRIAPPTDPAKFDAFIKAGANPLDRYYRAVDTFTGADGQPDWDGKVADYRASLSDADKAYIDRNSGLTGTPLQQLRSKISNEYNAIPIYRGYTPGQGRAIDTLVTDARARAKGGRSTTPDDTKILQAMRQLAKERGIAESSPGFVAARRAVLGILASDKARDTYRKAHPEYALVSSNAALTPQQIAAINKRIGGV